MALIRSGGLQGTVSEWQPDGKIAGIVRDHRDLRKIDAPLDGHQRLTNAMPVFPDHLPVDQKVGFIHRQQRSRT